jgi:hypothetical protein
MKILIKPKEFIGTNWWQSKMNGVILVEKTEDILPLWNLLVEQDYYWKEYRHVIQVAPKEIDGDSDISRMCVYVGKTDIDNPQELQSIIPFIMYQEPQEIM